MTNAQRPPRAKVAKPNQPVTVRVRQQPARHTVRVGKMVVSGWPVAARLASESLDCHRGSAPGRAGRRRLRVQAEPLGGQAAAAATVRARSYRSVAAAVPT